MSTTPTLPPEDTVRILGNYRRYLLLDYLGDLPNEPDPTISLREVALYIWSVENDALPDEASADDYKSAYVGLYQEHVPMLEAEGVVEYDDGTIRPGPNAEATLASAARL